MPAATRRRRPALHKSQSAITYAVQKIEALLKVKLFETQRPQGAAHRQRRGALPARQGRCWRRPSRWKAPAAHLAAGWESELKLAVEIIFPTWLLLRCFELFAQERPDTRIELYETVLSGTDEALIQRRVDLAICSQIPPGFIGDALMPMQFVAGGTSGASAAQTRPQAHACRTCASTASW